MSIADVNKKLASLEPKVDELLELLKKFTSLVEKLNKQASDPEAIAAKIISDLSKKIDDKDCCKEIIQEIRNNKPKDKDDKTNPLVILEPNSGPKYTFPNFLVGNANLGSSGDPEALTWPFDK